MVIELQHRAPRVRFKHPVRVVPLDGAPRIYRTLTANLSRKGMFVRMPEPLPKGTRVALSLEAAGQALPFAEAEIAWCRTSQSQWPGRYAGFGVRFTSFLNPRAPELVEYLVRNLDRGRPLRVAPATSLRKRWLLLALLSLVGLGITALLSLSLSLGVGGEEEKSPAVAAPVAAEGVGVEGPVEAPAAAIEPPSPAPLVAAVPAGAPEAPLAREAPTGPVSASTPPPGAEANGPVESLAAAAKSAPARAPHAAPRASAPPSPPNRLALPSGALEAFSWSGQATTIHLALELAPGASLSRAFFMASPPRLVLDLDGKAPKKSFTLGPAAAWLEQVRIGPHGPSTRVVLDLKRAPEGVSQSADGVTLSFSR